MSLGFVMGLSIVGLYLWIRCITTPKPTTTTEPEPSTPVPFESDFDKHMKRMRER